VEVDPYGFIARHQAMVVRGLDPHALAARIAAVLRTNPLTKGPMAEATVDRFVRTYSFNDARDNLKRLQELPHDLD
jgi:hypothetical protein